MMKLLVFLLATTLLFSETQQEAINDLPIDSYPTAAAWYRLGVHDHRGIDVPLLSLHSSHSSGNGEFFDLLPLINWMANNGMDTLQLLPLNDTGTVASPSIVPFHLMHFIPFTSAWTIFPT